jgi:large conductance mechanosensitive channel
MFLDLSGTNPASLAAAKESGAAVFAYGAFITALINFIIIGWVVFMLVKFMNKLMPPKPAAPAAPAGPSETELLAEILATLKK